MLSDELRNLACWLQLYGNVPMGDETVANVLDELAEQAERLEANTRLTGEEVAERIALEAYRP
jgi:hypothetical protein